LDYVGIEALLSEEERLIRDTVRGWSPLRCSP
jgi:hypothetical protein